MPSELFSSYNKSGGRLSAVSDMFTFYYEGLYVSQQTLSPKEALGTFTNLTMYVDGFLVRGYFFEVCLNKYYSDISDSVLSLLFTMKKVLALPPSTLLIFNPTLYILLAVPY